MYKIFWNTKPILQKQVPQITSQIRCHRMKTKSSLKLVCTGPKKELVDLHSKVALITGGAEGIGLTVAHELLSEEVCHVALAGIHNCSGRDAVQHLNNIYGKNKTIFVNCDVQSRVQVCDCYSKVLKEFGKIDVVVNCAGVFDGCNWETEITTNLMGTINSMLEAYKIMSKDSKGSGGVILNFSGLFGMQPFSPAPTLSSTYAALIGLSRSFGHETNFNITGVRVVSLCPGITNTNFLKDADRRALSERMGTQLKTLLQKVKRQKADVCGQSALHVIKYGPSGSVWVVDGSKLYSLNIPDWKEYRSLESQLL